MLSITNQKILYPILILSITLSFYVLLAGRFKYEFPVSASNYFNHLSYSFLNGRLDLFTNSWGHDLTIWQGKKYMYWGPSPILLILPFVWLFGLNISDVSYVALICSFGPLVLYLILKELDSSEIAKISDFKKFILSIFLGFGTVYFVLSVNGGIWFTSQAISTLYILISLLLILKFKRINKLSFLIPAIIFLCLGIWGRATFIFYLPFFLYIITSAKNLKKWLITFLLICSFFFCLFAAYNYLRFGSILENGYSLTNMASTFAENKQKYGVINITYFPTNFYYMFLNFPSLKSAFPYLQFNYMGNSIFSTSPLFLLLFIFLKRKCWEKPNIFFNGSVLVSIISITIFLLFFFGTGYYQFGYRYLMDAIPLMMILLAQTVKNIHISIILILCLLSIAITTAGVLWFLNIL